MIFSVSQTMRLSKVKQTRSIAYIAKIKTLILGVKLSVKFRDIELQKRNQIVIVIKIR